ncbi:hypothetical protein L198_07443 [Cryptococcus wingfieldii CBS 7118]|uniref:HSF-type DNA-binding domain-containing protein n=1 Tax=Cryptococcus wingfieldii CBS 7118 TaxID=1295528 RepID=A0A1E3IBN9_9TREE|nr:hypothetical protein L198_07443 [Cryptococcus wingfieldii CBS 7118]ODN85878.1 hypothetical protein L198_07443 [Cryptococcus wingfieldii CBS 7118]
MTTNLYAVAGPSTHPSPEEPASPLRSIPSLPANHPSLAVSTSAVPGVGVSKPGLSVDEHGEVLKVPAFLNKLYTMVSDETVNELIYWGDNGDSFFVPNSEQFGRELLPRWFKHSNFSSFVRQLNMYGFHKVPHLQSGALKTETPVELWEFANPYFKRGQPQLLAKVTRKNNRPSTSAPTATSPVVPGVSTRSSAAPALPPQGGGGKYLITDGTTEGENTALVAPNQMIDLSAIQNGIAAIRQTQSTISADLRKLQASNEALWRQAYETQEKQRKHEETIDLIVSFLERLFGTEGEGLKGLKEAMRRGVGARQGRDREGSDGAEEAQGSAKKRRRVGLERMISNRSPVEDDDDDDRLVEIGSSVPLDSPSASGRFQSLPSEDSRPTPGPTSSDPTLGINALSPMSDFDPLQPSNNNALAPYYSLPPPTSSAYPQPQNQNQNQKQSVQEQSNLSAPLLSPTTTSSLASSLNLDPVLLQTTIGSLLQSPAAAQMFLNSLNASAQGQAVNGGGRSANGGGGAAGQDPTLALFSPLPQANQPNPSSSLSHAQPSSFSQSQNQSQALLQQNSELLKSYQDALGVSDGLDGLQGSIDELVRSMGLDLPTADGSLSGTESGLGQGQGVGQGVGADGGAGGEDFNVDEFLESLGKEEDDPLAGAVAVPQPDAPGAGITKVERE